MMNRVEEAEQIANRRDEAQRKAESDLRSAYGEMIEFKRRHGIPIEVYLEDLNLNEWGTWQPKPDPNP